MAITQTIAPSTTNANDHVFEATESTAITTIHLCNLTAATATVNIYLLPEDGSTTAPSENNKLYNELNINGKDSYIIDTEKMILVNGDKIYVENVGSSGQVAVTISTIGV